MRAGLAFAIFAASVACSNAATTVELGCFTLVTLESCCDSIDGRAGEYSGQKCVPTKALEAGEDQTQSNEFGQNHVCQPECWVKNTCEYTKPAGSFGDQTTVEGECPAPAVTVTTTHTPWDSSASSSADSASLESSWSSSFKDESSADSSGESGFLGSGSSNDGSFDSSGSEQSGSSGSYMFHWQWLLLLLCCCAAVIAPLLKPKPKKKAPKKPTGPAKTTLASDHPAGCTYLEVASQAGFKAGDIIEIAAGTATAELQEVTGLGSILLAAPILYPHVLGTPVQVVTDGRKPAGLPMLVPSTSTVLPSYQMAPATMSYAAPVTTAYAAPTTSMAYAAPAYAAPAAYTTGTTAYSVGGGVAI